jgi:hypothetical protein
VPDESGVLYYYVPLSQFLHSVFLLLMACPWWCLWILFGPYKTDFWSSVLFGPTKIHCLYVSGTCYGFFCLLTRGCTGVVVFYVRLQCCCSVRHYFWVRCFARASQNLLVFLSISVCYLCFTSVLVGPSKIGVLSSVSLSGFRLFLATATLYCKYFWNNFWVLGFGWTKQKCSLQSWMRICVHSFACPNQN